MAARASKAAQRCSASAAASAECAASRANCRSRLRIGFQRSQAAVEIADPIPPYG